MSNFSLNSLVNLDWKFGVCASTDELRQAGSTFLQLKLVFADQREVFMELTLPQFFQFLGEMEKVKANLESFS
ncbi:hypothetical protein PAPYR_2363 [Paratrimastix pyriformis]|uniref:COMM domain-containing protein n=1 Tax=Paratrimastix pyriformis TaxID=342808 RepID=A0ABQ8UVB6_9EUKA|nr:hypothetical protein PAPYR_2363 [Paratrimastix pyriformis]